MGVGFGLSFGPDGIWAPCGPPMRIWPLNVRHLTTQCMDVTELIGIGLFSLHYLFFPLLLLLFLLKI